MSPVTAEPKRHRTLLLTLGLLTTITAVISSLGAPLIPAIADTYDVAITDAQWALTAALLTAAVATPILGRLGAGQLRRQTIVVGLALVTIGAILSALPWGFAPLVVGRGLQGIGIALVPLALAVARDAIAPPAISPAIALLSVTAVAGAGLGFPLTAVIAQIWGLSATYWLGAILSATTLLMAWRFIPTGPPTIRLPVDWTGALLLSIGMGAALVSVSKGVGWGWGSTRTLVLGVTGIVLVAAWILWSLRRPHPLVDLRLATHPGVAAPNLVAFGGGIGMYTLLTSAILLVQNPSWGLDGSISLAGMMLVPYSVMSVLGSRLALIAMARMGAKLLLPIGCLIFASATAGLAFAHDHIGWVLLWMGIGGIGGGFTFSSLAVLIVPHIPQAETSSALAFNLVLRYLGFCVGSAVSVSLMSIYGGGDQGFTSTLLTMSAVFGGVGGGAWSLARRDTGR